VDFGILSIADRVRCRNPCGELSADGHVGKSKTGVAYCAVVTGVSAAI
jgi:hypothetical protein